DRFGGPAQLLGWLCLSRASAAKIRTRGIELRRRVAGKPGHDGSLRASLTQESANPRLVPRRSAGRRKARLDVQHAGEARRPLVPRICKELRPQACTVAV